MKRLLACAVTWALAVAPAAAQSPDPIPGNWMSAWPDGPPASGLAPALWLGSHGVGYAVGGTLAVGMPGSGGLGLGAPADGGPALEFGARAGAGSLESPGDQVGILSARFRPGGPLRNTWLAVSVLKSDDREMGALPLVGAGAWVIRGRFNFAMRTVQILSQVRTGSHLVTGPGALPLDTTSTTGRNRTNGVRENDYRLLTGAEGSVGWTAGRVELQTRAGVMVALHQRPAQWGEARVAYWPLPGWSVFARARSATGVPEALEAVRGTHAALGIQLAPGRGLLSRGTRERLAVGEGMVVRALDDGRFLLRLRARARSVELRCDATDWNPVRAERTEAEAWEVVLPLSPGVHRVAVRLDGGPWRPPAGLPTAADDFGGEVGLIVVE